MLFLNDDIDDLRERERRREIKQNEFLESIEAEN